MRNPKNFVWFLVIVQNTKGKRSNFERSVIGRFLRSNLGQKLGWFGFLEPIFLFIKTDLAFQRLKSKGKRLDFGCSKTSGKGTSVYSDCGIISVLDVRFSNVHYI